MWYNIDDGYLYAKAGLICGGRTEREMQYIVSHILQVSVGFSSVLRGEPSSCYRWPHSHVNEQRPDGLSLLMTVSQ